jgi:signal transduction histidine kinase
VGLQENGITSKTISERGFSPLPLFPAGEFPSGKSAAAREREGPMLTEEILVVNDGSLLLQMIGGLFQNRGYQLNLTDSPEEALVLLATRNIVLVVLKLDGPQPDRLAVLQAVKELNGAVRLVIVGEATHLPPEIFEVEADDYILLPCRIADLWRRLNRCLEAPAPSAVSTVASRQPDELLHPVNQRVLSNLSLLFHDLQGLLTAINEGMNSLERHLDGRFGEEVEAIFQQTFRKTQVLMTLSTEFFQKFRQRPRSERVDLIEEVIEPVVEELSEDMQKSRITLDNRLFLRLPTRRAIRGDRAALKSVFRNLLHNAITHGGCGSTITFDLDEDQRHFRLQVQNRGAPIPPSRPKALFSGLNQDRGNSEGWGLYLGQQVMRSMGGDVTYESGRQGSNFILTLPRA